MRLDCDFGEITWRLEGGTRDARPCCLSSLRHRSRCQPLLEVSVLAELYGSHGITSSARLGRHEGSDSRRPLGRLVRRIGRESAVNCSSGLSTTLRRRSNCNGCSPPRSSPLSGRSVKSGETPTSRLLFPATCFLSGIQDWRTSSD